MYVCNTSSCIHLSWRQIITPTKCAGLIGQWPTWVPNIVSTLKLIMRVNTMHTTTMAIWGLAEVVGRSLASVQHCTTQCHRALMYCMLPTLKHYWQLEHITCILPDTPFLFILPPFLHFLSSSLQLFPYSSFALSPSLPFPSLLVVRSPSYPSLLLLAPPSLPLSSLSLHPLPSTFPLLPHCLKLTQLHLTIHAQ